MSTRRVTAAELFLLADDIMKLTARAEKTVQQGVLEALDGALRKVLEGAKSAAFNEAQTEHNRWLESQSSSSTESK